MPITPVPTPNVHVGCMHIHTRIVQKPIQYISRTLRILMHRAYCEATTTGNTTAQEKSQDELFALQEEYKTALQTARSCSTRSERLHSKALVLKSAALKAMQQGDEDGARNLLELKARVQEGAASSNRRAAANMALAAKLEEAMTRIQR